MQKNIITLDFANQNIPLPIEGRNTSDNTYVNWGLDNLYPLFLLGLYNNSAIHAAIINQKTNYIISDGLVDQNGKKLSFDVNPNEDINDFLYKVVNDFLIFNAFCVEVTFNVFGQPIQFYHIPFHNVRMNKSKTKFWFNEDWLLSRKTIVFDRYTRQSTEDVNSKIFFFTGYNANPNRVYPITEYNGLLKTIDTDIAIKEFNLNNLKNHFSPSTIITFFNGNNVQEQVKKQIVDEIEEKFKGQSGKKFIVDFQTKDGKSSEIKQLSSNDWDKAYSEIYNQVLTDIMIGHQVQNAELFGLQVAGKLGNGDQKDSFNFFKKNYVQVKRNIITKQLMKLFMDFEPFQGVTAIEFKDKNLFENEIDNQTKLRIYTINELRKEAGLPPIENGDVLLS
jgi:hypothetical protein